MFEGHASYTVSCSGGKKNCVAIKYLSLYMHTVYSNQQGSYKLPTKGIKVSGRRDAIDFPQHLRIIYD